MRQFFSQPTGIFASFAAAALLLPSPLARAHAQSTQSDPQAVSAVRAAVVSQMAADHHDHSNWVYTDHDVTPQHDFVYECVGSPKGELRLPVQDHGHPLSEAARQTELDHLAAYVNDPAAQARTRKNQAHDDAQATELLKMLPDAFIWTIASQTSEYLTLNYRPDPNFDPPDMQSRVMGALEGQLVIARKGDLIYTLHGKLNRDVKIGFGLLAKLYKGGTIDVERRDVGSGHWEIVETHIHIAGHALFFKTIGTQQNEVKTNWRPSTAQDLHEAEDQLRNMK